MAAKTMIRIVLTAILLVALAGGAVAGLYMCSSGTPLEGARTAALNAALDASGIKGRIDSELRNKVNSATADYWFVRDLLNGEIDKLAINDWQVTNSPDSATAKQTFDLDAQDSKIHITTYDDPSVITVKSDGKYNTYGQSITFKVPESAQPYAEALPYLSAAEDLGVTDALTALGNAQEGAGSEQS